MPSRTKPQAQAEAEAAGATAKKPRRRAPAASKPKAPELPKCEECRAVLTWRDTAYGRKGRCKRCTQRRARQAEKGRFIPAAEYARQLRERNRPLKVGAK